MRSGLFGSVGIRFPARRVMAVTAVGLMLAGCSGGIGGGGNEGPMGTGNAGGQGGFGSTLETTTVKPTSGPSTPPPNVPAAPPLPAPVTAATGTGARQTAVAANNETSNSTAGVNADDYTCPGIQVRSGAGSWQVTDKADGAVRYQASLGTFSRECHFSRPDMNMRVGIQGRVLLGAKGGPGKLSVPIRLAVVEEGPSPKPVWTKLYSVPVEIGQGILQVDFGLVADDVNFPLPTPDKLERYVVYVGFDSQAGQVEARPGQRSQTTRPAAAAKPKPVQPKPTQPKPVVEEPDSEPAETAPATSSAPVAAPKASPAPAASTAAPAASSGGQQQWIGAPAPAAGGFSQ